MQEKSSVYFISLGCPKNLVDSQVMLGRLQNKHYELSATPEAAEIIIVNTCSFIQASQEESIATLLEMASYKETGHCQILVATGCLPQRYAKELEKDMPEVDLFIGTGQYHLITDILSEYHEQKISGASAGIIRRSYVDQPAFIHTEQDQRVQTGVRFAAFLKISEGCNRRCAFCIIPKLRGNVRSRTIESLVQEATQLVAGGVRELNLVAQDLTEYGMEWKYKQSLEQLLPELCQIPGLDWIRLHYIYPDAFSQELVEIVAREPKIVKYLDMPIQHTQTHVLKTMNRKLTREKLFQLIAELRASISGIVFRTSIIVGFPGETESDFQALCEDLQALDLDHVGVFQYSKEEGTPAALHDGQVHPSTKRRRVALLRKLLKEQSRKKLRQYVGQRVSVMLEGASSESDLLLQGRMPTQAQEIDGCVLINQLPEGVQAKDLRPGDFIEVEITEAHTHDLLGAMTGMISRSRQSADAGEGLRRLVEQPADWVALA